jgi:hypothetical protein
MRASKISEYCPRAEILAARNDVVRERVEDVDRAVVLGYGDGLHFAVQNELLPRLPDNFYGAWRCRECGEVQGGLVYPPTFRPQDLCPRPGLCVNSECPNSKKTQPARYSGKDIVFEYEETDLYFETLWFGGHLDGLLFFPEARADFGVLEIKSISHMQEMEIREAPKDSHTSQIQAYLWFTGLRWGIILYWIKGINGIEAWVEHYIERDEQEIQRIADLVQTIKIGIEDPDVPLPARSCKSQEDLPARGCGLCTKCFEMDVASAGIADLMMTQGLVEKEPAPVLPARREIYAEPEGAAAK